jgi:outer membrane protein assembly factor BamE (lipoprotein component of BamABCDE complex)
MLQGFIRLGLPLPPARSLLPLLALAPLCGCFLPGFMTYPPQVRGNLVSSDSLNELVPGTSTRADVTSLLGPPTVKAPFDDNQWVYVGEVTKPVIGGTQQVLNQQAVVVSFDSKGVLTGITHKGAGDSLPVAVVTATTPSPGTNASVLQQLLGNVGRFTPGGPVGGDSSATPNRSSSGSNTGL